MPCEMTKKSLNSKWSWLVSTNTWKHWTHERKWSDLMRCKNVIYKSLTTVIITIKHTFEKKDNNCVSALKQIHSYKRKSLQQIVYKTSKQAIFHAEKFTFLAQKVSVWYLHSHLLVLLLCFEFSYFHWFLFKSICHSLIGWITRWGEGICTMACRHWHYHRVLLQQKTQRQNCIVLNYILLFEFWLI